MIGRLRGQVLEVQENVVLIDVAGVGYEVEVAVPYAFELAGADSVELHTHLVVREDAQSLFGFASVVERDMFRALIRINGVGPKLGITLLSALPPADFARCIAEQDTATLKKVPGIGQRTAERLVVDLKNRLDEFEAPGPPVVAENAAVADAESALVSLGYKAPEAAAVIGEVFVEGAAAEDLIRLALRRMAAHEGRA